MAGGEGCMQNCKEHKWKKYVYFGAVQLHSCYGSHYTSETNHRTPWSRVLDNLIVTQLVRKFPAFYGTRRFVTVFTKAHF